VWRYARLKISTLAREGPSFGEEKDIKTLEDLKSWRFNVESLESPAGLRFHPCREAFLMKKGGDFNAGLWRSQCWMVEISDPHDKVLKHGMWRSLTQDD
jgi:hypothetical protein